jgi:hypothetical protein
MQVFIVFSILTSLLFEVFAVALLKGILLNIDLYNAFHLLNFDQSLYMHFIVILHIFGCACHFCLCAEFS